MATLRASSTPITTIFRAAAASQQSTSALRRCTHCLRAQRCPFSSFRPVRQSQSSKRPLMTDSAYRPQTLSPDIPPPPRNAGVPDTSIAGGEASAATTQTSWPPSSPWERKESSAPNSASTSTISLRESEAQKSKPVTTASSQPSPPPPSPDPTTTTPKKSKLRPRKAAMTLSPKAVEQLHDLFQQPTSQLIRVGVKNRGCSGLAYHLEYVEKPGAFDESVEQDGVKVLIDSKALFSIIGSEMDWVEDKLSARFVFRNPNITEQCGCGESFSIS